MQLLTLVTLASLAIAYPGAASGATLEIPVLLQTMDGSAAIGAQRVPLLQLHVTPPCGNDIKLLTLQLRLRGAGDRADLSAVYAMVGAKRVTRGTIADRDGRITLRFNGLILQQCRRTIVTIAGDIAVTAEAGGEHQLQVVSAETFPASTLLLRDGGSASGSLTVRSLTTGTIQAEILPLHTPVRYGKARAVARLRLEAEGERVQLVRSISFTNEGSAGGEDLQRLFLQRSNGERLSPRVHSMDGNTVTIPLEPALLLDRGDTVLLELKADVMVGRRRSIEFVIEEAADIETSLCTGKRSCIQAH